MQHHPGDNLTTEELIHYGAEPVHQPALYRTLQQIREAPVIVSYRRRPERPSFNAAP